MSWLDPCRKRWDNRAIDRTSDRYWQSETKLIFHLSFVVVPVLIAIAIATQAEITPAVAAICAALFVFAAGALGQLIRRIKHQEFNPRAKVTPSYSSEAELKVDADERRQAFENLKRLDD